MEELESANPAEEPLAKFTQTSDTAELDPEVVPAAATEPVVEPIVQAATAEPPRPILWPTSPVVGDLRGVPLYSLQDFSQALDGADAAHREFLAGDLSQKESVASMGKAYIKLCELADRFTLTDPTQYGNDLVTKQVAAKELFRGTAGDPLRRNDLAMIAGRWLQHDRRQNQGVILLGRVGDLQARGAWTEYAVNVPLGDATAQTAVMMEGVRFSVGDEIAVVGAIVPNPSEHLLGYDGVAPQVVVAGFAFTPQDYKAPAAGETTDIFSLDSEPAGGTQN